MGRRVGSPVFEVETIGEMISGPELRQLVEDRLGVSVRQANASISSWSVELDPATGRPWMPRDAQGRPATRPTSAYNRCAEQLDRRDESRRENGRRGRRPSRKVSGDG
jgi:hypothetical protein